MNKKTLKLLLSVLSAVLLLGVLCYLVNHMASRISDDIETVAVTRGSYSKHIDADIYIFRDEIPLMRSRDGSSCYLVSNGGKVALGQGLALGEPGVDHVGLGVVEQLGVVERLDLGGHVGGGGDGGGVLIVHVCVSFLV